VKKNLESFVISVTYEEEFGIEELWLNGDTPENPTSDDVLKLISRCGGADRIVQDWNFDTGYVAVTPVVRVSA